MFNTILGALQGNNDPNVEAIREEISGSLSIRKAAIKVCEKLDTVWEIKDLKSLSPLLIENLDELSEPFKHVSAENVMIVLAEYLFSLFKEETVRYDVVPAVYVDVMTWLAIDTWNAVTGSRVVGKAELRARILSHLNDSKGAVIPATSGLPDDNPKLFKLYADSCAEGDFHSPSTRTPHLKVETEEKSNDVTAPFQSLFEPPSGPPIDLEVHGTAMRRAEALLRIGVIGKFDGLSDSFLGWRYSIYELLSSYHCWVDWSGYYVVITSLTGIAADLARTVVLSANAGDTIRALLQTLDKRFLTAQTLSAFEAQFEGIRQSPNEGCEAFAARFMRMATIRSKVFGPSSDVQLRIKFARGLSHQFEWIRSLADSLA